VNVALFSALKKNGLGDAAQTLYGWAHGPAARTSYEAVASSEADADKAGSSPAA
jgi:GTP-binding protein